jgi:hypothetical protein
VSIVPPRLSITAYLGGVLYKKEVNDPYKCRRSFRNYSQKQWLPVQEAFGILVAVTVSTLQLCDRSRCLIQLKRHSWNHLVACASVFQVEQRVHAGY